MSIYIGQKNAQKIPINCHFQNLSTRHLRFLLLLMSTSAFWNLSQIRDPIIVCRYWTGLTCNRHLLVLNWICDKHENVYLYMYGHCIIFMSRQLGADTWARLRVAILYSLRTLLLHAYYIQIYNLLIRDHNLQAAIAVK